MADEPRDALRRLEQRLSSASDAAERLIAEAARTAERKPPPAGWQAPAGEERSGSELDTLIQAVRALRELIPPDVLERLATALKELLLAVRALIDWYLERLERRRTSGPTEVEDIPIA
jgi:sugar-specific transcriptional regulator TrmB